MRIYLFGYLDDDFYGRVVLTPAEHTVADLAQQLVSWAPVTCRGASFVTNEAGAVLDPAATLDAAGLRNGDIFTVATAGEE